MSRSIDCPPFRGRYRFAFLLEEGVDLDNLASWVVAMFGSDPAVYDVAADPRRLYVRGDSEAVLVKLTWADIIAECHEATGEAATGDILACNA